MSKSLLLLAGLAVMFAVPGDATPGPTWPTGPVAKTDATALPAAKPLFVHAGEDGNAVQAAIGKLAATIGSVEGVSLEDDVEAVTAGQGEPLAIEQDESDRQTRTYVYDNLRVGFGGEFVQYVEVQATAAQIRIGDVDVPMRIDAIARLLGRPDFVGEDGIGYRRGDVVLKLSIDAGTGALQSVRYYHMASV